MKIGIYIATQARHDFPKDPAYKPLLVGKIDNDSGIELNDSAGDSISEKNKFYCELTGHYWIWKNDQISDIVGLCHYRRFFWLKDIPFRLCEKSFKTLAECENFLSTENLEKFMRDYEIILPRAYAFSADTVKSQFIKYHGEENFRLMFDAIKKLFPNYIESFEEVFDRRYVHLANLIIARREIFDAYSEWLFKILSEIESKADLTDKKNLRLPGYLGERLLNVYVYHNKLKLKEVPQIFISGENNPPRKDLYINLRYIKRKYFPAVLDFEQKLRKKKPL